MFKDLVLTLAIGFLILLGVVILNSVSRNLFPGYFVYIIFAFLVFWFFSQLGFEIVSLFSVHFYVLSIAILLVTLILGRISHGTIRWIQIGTSTFQPSELIRPFMLVFFADFLTKKKMNLKRLIYGITLLLIPVFLILVQPSLSVSILTFIGFMGALIAADFNKKYLLIGLGILAVIAPVFWFVMAPYQKARLTSFLNPGQDPLGTGYNSIQSTIAAGAGKLFGRGLGRGIQTQLSFLPEKQTDFIYAAIGEELGFVGTMFVLLATFLILFRLTNFMEKSYSPAARAYLAGFFLTYLVQVSIHVAMNLGIFPVTGLPFPLVSAGGSSLLATMIGLGIAVGAYKK